MTAVVQLSFVSCRSLRLSLSGRQHVRFSSRSKNSVVDKNKTGKAIKKLNIENKYLFGDLLDRPGPKHSKKVVQQSPTTAKSSNRPLDGIQSEIIWYQAMGQKLKTDNKLYENEGNEPKLFSSQHFFVDSDQKHDPISTPEVILGNDGTLVPKISETSCSKTEPDGSSKTTSASRQSLQLPDVIIRNIETFPCFNTQTTTDDTSSQCDPILNISRQEEKYFSYPSVTKILNATMSDASIAALARWKQKMVAELGEEGFVIYQAGLLRNGAQFHQTIHNHLAGVPEAEEEIDPEISGSWHSLAPVITSLSHVKVLESHVVHPQLMYRGVIDCVADYKGTLAVIEWKKSDKCKQRLANTYDAPLQLAAYLGAMNFDVNYPFQAQHGVVVVAYTDGSPANVFTLQKSDCAHYWSLWLRRLHRYWQKQITSNQPSDQ